ncbi:MAG: hypothetical protein OEV30_03675 [Ignavibacteria bacterium]|nr:hypothetical protein [Ignavibacteria bacterium]
MKVSLTTEEIERWRDRVHRRTPRLAVSTERQATRFIDDVGFCFAFKSVNSELPCLWHAACGQRKPLFPEHTHTDPFLSFVWKMKQVLPAKGKAFYGRIFRKRPTMISMSFFPDFYALSQRTGHRDDYIEAYRKEGISETGKEIMDALRHSSPQVTRGLKLALGVPQGKAREFDKAMAELQAKFFIVKTAEHYDPFTFEWNMVDKAYPREVRKARKIDTDAARTRILSKYFENQLVSTVRSIQSVFGWKKQIIYQTMGTLMKDGIITGGITVDGKDGKYYSLVR